MVLVTSRRDAYAACEIAWCIQGKYETLFFDTGGNVRLGALDIILSEYPSHGFIIDR